MKQANIAEMGVDAQIISQNPNIMSGVPAFPGTRVPVRLLLDYLRSGRTLKVFLCDFPTVTKEKAVNVLELAFERTIGPRDPENLIR